LPRWLTRRDIEYFHSVTIRHDGGLAGAANQDALEATLARPENLLAYEPRSTIPRLAACYGFGFAQKHCFPDSNKRIALASIGVFLADNKHDFTASEVETAVTIRALAAGELSEQELTHWIEAVSFRRSDAG